MRRVHGFAERLLLSSVPAMEFCPSRAPYLTVATGGWLQLALHLPG